MKPAAWLKLAAAAAALAGTASAVDAQKKAAASHAPQAPPARDWARLVSPTPEGGFRIGNPAAAVKVVEFGSFTCSHCAQFAVEGFPVLLRDHVRGGRVSFEFRNYVRDPYDMAGALVARCASPANFFPLAHRIFDTRDQWIGKFQALTQDQVRQLEALPVPQRMVRYAEIAGFTALAAQAGVPAAKAQQCLTDKKNLDQLIAIRQVALNRYNLQGTPSFLVNGKMTEAYSWTELKPLLKPPAV
ncbi:MAG TPA: thioredoxin domain-containing protein [Allosphingosinicella sp.]|nr:thioredoxin domain-containing protein [Allosphingosinicella sp.]